MVELDKKWTLIVTVIVIIIGVIMHYFYEWSNENKLVGYFAPVNESVWEHLKLLLFPLLVAVAFEVYVARSKGQKVNNVWTALIVSALVGMTFIVTTFYTYTGAITSKSVVTLDILTFIIAAALSSIVVHYLFKWRKFSANTEIVSIIVLIITILVIFRFSYKPPTLPIFEETLEA